MRRVALYGIGWIAAAAVAVLLAWQGVGLVGRNVTDNHAKPLTADEARQALGEAPTTTVPVGSTSPAGTATTGSTTRPGATTATARPTSTGPTTGPTTRPTTGPTAMTSPPAAGGTVRTYNLAGGSTALRFDPSGVVMVVWAHPNPGFAAEVDDRDDGGVRVRFDGDSGRSQVEAWWDGSPRDRVDEQAGDDELDD